MDEVLDRNNPILFSNTSSFILLVWKEDAVSDIYHWYLLSFDPEALPSLVNVFKGYFPDLADKVNNYSETTTFINGVNAVYPAPAGGGLNHFRYFVQLVDVINVRRGEYRCGKYLITADLYEESDDFGLEPRKYLRSSWYIHLPNDEFADSGEVKETAAPRTFMNTTTVHVCSIFSDFSCDEDIGEWYAKGLEPETFALYEEIVQDVFKWEELFGDITFYEDFLTENEHKIIK